uniref:Putative plasmid copy-number control protein n=2 Tax=Lactobacillales TaxID=186826 RepID=R9WSK4_LACPA|nr:putative plasmid copy-number control protein [Lacticaseibacillus paracasei]
MATNKKRITVSLTEDQYFTLENLAKEKGFSKSAILALALENYSRKELEQKNKRKLGLGKTIVSAKHCCSIKAILTLWQKTNQDTSPFCYIPNLFQKIGNRN